jgi:hypothetical protein
MTAAAALSGQNDGRQAGRRSHAGILSFLGMLIVLALSACDPEARLQGRLTGSDGRALTVGEIRIECPQLCLYAPVHGDRGEFDESEISRGCPLSCQLRATSAGHRDFVGAASTYCVKRDGSLCSEFHANVELDRTQ